MPNKVQIEQIYTGCVAEAAYFITSGGEACVIDPLRETTPYLERLEKTGTKLKYIFETHFHADFVSGHVDLRKATGADIIYGPLAEPLFDAIVAEDHQVFNLGEVKFTVLHTPGHTMESSCFLLEEDEKPIAIFTGDTLFIGDVGRPDLAQKGKELTQEDLAAHLFHSLRDKVMPLPDDVVVYPAHGAGSACGKNLSSETFDTLGNQKKTNYALRADMNVAEFTKELITGLHPPPPYFPANVAKNKGIGLDKQYDHMLELARKEVTIEDVEKAIAQGGTNAPFVLDTRSAAEFVAGYIRGSIFTGLDDGAFGPHLATAIGNVHRPYIILPCSIDRLDEITTRMCRFGFDHPMGHLPGGVETWKAAGKPLDTLPSLTPAQLFEALQKDPNIYVVDVRKPGEYKAARHAKAVNITLDANRFAEVDTSKTVYAHCAGGYRSVIFLSILRSLKGAELPVYNILGGFWAMQENPDLAKDIAAAPCERAIAEAKAKAEAEAKEAASK